MTSVTVHLENHRIALVHGQANAVLRGHLKINPLLEATKECVSCVVRFVGIEQANRRARTLIDTVYRPPVVLPRTTFSLLLPTRLPPTFLNSDIGNIRYNVIVRVQCGKETIQAIQPIEIYHSHPPNLRSRLVWSARKQWRYELETPHTIRLDHQPDEEISIRIKPSGMKRHYELATCLVECCLSEAVRIGHIRSDRSLLNVTQRLTSSLLSWRHHCLLIISHDELLTIEPRASTSSSWIQVQHKLRIVLTFYDGLDGTERVMHEIPVILTDMPDLTVSLDDICCNSDSDSHSHDSAICLTCSSPTTPSIFSKSDLPVG